MPKLAFEGYSDDTFGEYAHTKDDYDCCASGALIVYQISSPDGFGMNVVGQYGGKQWPKDCPACWFIGVQPVDEDDPLPDWPMRFEMADSGYSPRLVIDAPDGVQLRCLNKKREQ